MMTMTTAISLMEKTIAFALVIQALELFALRATFSESGVWRWSTLEKELGNFWSAVLRPVLKTPAFNAIVLLQAVLAIGLALDVRHAFFPIALFACLLLTCVRWRGSFSGGADSLALIVLAASSVVRASGVDSKPARWALFYVAVQVTLSYTLAGIAKVREQKWRSGEALPALLRLSAYGVSERILQYFTQNKSVALAASWLVLVFELTFAAIWLYPAATPFILGAGIVFHAMNAVVLGLNRFFWVWLAAYPALWFALCHLVLSKN